ncbi:MAG: hypothetical protein HKL96_06910 [Phycisphaerales bacterium]|nr:hypothetical protein [Phycisphaerales bacterium]
MSKPGNAFLIGGKPQPWWRAGLRTFFTRPKHALGWLWRLLVIALILMLLSWCLTLWTPRWYQPLSATSPIVQEQAREAQSLVLNLRNQVQNPHIRYVKWIITQNQVNSLLSLVYDESSASEHKGRAAMVQQPFVRFSNGRITLAARLHGLFASSVASITIGVRTAPALTPGAAPQGHIQILSLHSGELPIPRFLLIAELQSLIPRLAPSIEHTLDLYGGARYARRITPQIVSMIEAALDSRSFPLALDFNHRQMILRRLSVEASHEDQLGQSIPARLVIEFSAP